MGEVTEVQTEATDTSTVLTGDVAPQTVDDTVVETNTDTTTTDDTVVETNTDVDSRVAPDTYADFVMPEGVEANADLITEATPLFKELGLTQDQAQKLVDFQAKQAQASSESQDAAFNQLMGEWQANAKNDKEFGGDAFEENVGIARQAVDKFGTPELKQLLEEHGVGNHPEVIRFMVKVGKLTMDDVPGTGVAPVSKSQDRVSLLYPTDNNG